MPTEFYFLRHADARAGNKRHTSETPLTETGVSEAEKTAVHFSNTFFDACASSPAKRVRETLDIISYKTPIFINTWDLLKEINRSVDGITYEEGKEYTNERRKAIERKDKHWKYVSTDDSLWEIFLRAKEIKYKVLEEFKDQVCLIGGHSQVFSMLHTCFVFGDKPNTNDLFHGFNKYFLKPAAYSHVTWSPSKGWKINTFNNDKHLK